MFHSSSGGAVNWVRFDEIGGSGTLGVLELGSFRRNGERWGAGYAEIGFVSHILGHGMPRAYRDWVRFAKLGPPQVRRG